MPLIPVFHLRGTAVAADEVNRAVRRLYTAEEFTVASVIGLSPIPTVYWGTVWIVLRQAYESTALELPAGFEPEEYMMILPACGGRVTRAFGLWETGRVAAAVAVVDGGGRISGVSQGRYPAETALGFLEERP